MFQLSDYRVEILLAASGALAGCIIAFGISAWLLPVLLLPLVHIVLKNNDGKGALRTGLLLACFFFMPFYLIVFSWIVMAAPGNVQIRPDLVPLSNSFILLLVAVIYTIFALPFIWLTKSILSKYSARSLALIVVPAAWIVSEWTRSFGLSIAAWGHNGSLGDYWNFGSLGLAAMNTPLAELSSYTGMYGMSFLVMVLAVATYFGVRYRSYKPLLFTIGLTGVAIAVAATAHNAASHKTGAVRYGSVLQEKNFAPLLASATLYQHKSAEKKDLIVLPEYSNVFNAGYEPYAASVNKRLSTSGVSVEVASQNLRGLHASALLFRDNRGHIISARAKQLLIPTGEYMPLVLTALLDASGHPALVNHFNQVYELQRGEPPRVFQKGNVIYGSGACSSILGKNIYRQFANMGAQVFTNSANLDIFHGSPSYFRQSLQMARFHAMANDRYFIQGSQGAPAFVIGGNGQYIVKPTDSDTRFIDFSFNVISKKTIYTKLGEWVLPLSTIFLTLIWLPSLRLKRIMRRS